MIRRSWRCTRAVVQAQIPTCRVLRASNGAEAFAVMTHTRPDLVLLDLMMPVMDGFAVLKAMREEERTGTIPVIVLTAQLLRQEEMARLQKGVAAVLSKELFTPAEVLAQVEAALARTKPVGSEPQRLVRLAMAYIHEHYTEPISREDLARRFCVNERYLTRCFHQETGVTPIAYLIRYRIQQAKILLAAGQLSVTDVGLATGSRRRLLRPRIPEGGRHHAGRIPPRPASRLARNSSNRATKKFLSYKTDAASCGEIETANFSGARPR